MKLGTKSCNRCKRVLPTDNFYKNRAETTGLQRWCKDCSRDNTTSTKRKYREELNRIKTDAGCVDCGYNSHPEALEFDHLPGYTKLDKVSGLFDKGGSWSLVLEEVSKCEVVCANCHRVRTFNRRKTNGA